MSHERLYLVTYDIANPKRWRRIFRVMEAYGTWLQLSVFQCRLTARRRAALGLRLDREIKGDEDHVLILDIGPAEDAEIRIESLGKPFQTITRDVQVI